MTNDLSALVQRLRAIGGCHDGDCKVIPPVGMHTNGGCRCLRDPFRASQVVQAYRMFAGRDAVIAENKLQEASHDR